MSRHRKTFLRSRAFKVMLIVTLVLLALWLKGERLTLGALAARLLDLLSEVGVEGTVRKD